MKRKKRRENESQEEHLENQQKRKKHQRTLLMQENRIQMAIKTRCPNLRKKRNEQSLVIQIAMTLFIEESPQ